MSSRPRSNWTARRSPTLAAHRRLADDSPVMAGVLSVNASPFFPRVHGEAAGRPGGSFGPYRAQLEEPWPDLGHASAIDEHKSSTMNRSADVRQGEDKVSLTSGDLSFPSSSVVEGSRDGELGLGFPPPVLAPPANSTQRKYFGHFWKKDGSGGVSRSFAQVVKSRLAPVIMVQGREDRGRGREGFGAGRHGRGSGRGRGFSWHRDQEWRPMGGGRGGSSRDRQDFRPSSNPNIGESSKQSDDNSKWEKVVREEELKSKESSQEVTKGEQVDTAKVSKEDGEITNLPENPLECYKCGSLEHRVQHCPRNESNVEGAESWAMRLLSVIRNYSVNILHPCVLLKWKDKASFVYQIAPLISLSKKDQAQLL